LTNGSEWGKERVDGKKSVSGLEKERERGIVEFIGCEQRSELG
jgi:hypothetical protein